MNGLRCPAGRLASGIRVRAQGSGHADNVWSVAGRGGTSTCQTWAALRGAAVADPRANDERCKGRKAVLPGHLVPILKLILLAAIAGVLVAGPGRAADQL